MDKDNIKTSIKTLLEERFGNNAQYIEQHCEFKRELDYVLWTAEHPCSTYYPVSCEQLIEQALERAVWVHENVLTPETVQVGDGVTVRLWSDAHAATVIKKTKFSVTVRQDKATLNPNFKPEFIPGGFAAHCVNQENQTYTYEPDPSGTVYTFRWSNKYCTYGQPENLRLIKGRHEFYDYNF